jgi:hypothetical protein
MQAIQAIRAEMPTLGYTERQIVPDYVFADIPSGAPKNCATLTVPLVAFSRYPHSYQTACIGVVSSLTDIANYRALGAPLIFAVTPGANARIQPWSIRNGGPVELGEAFRMDAIRSTFAKYKVHWGAENLGRVKRASDATAPRDPQLELFDRGLLPSLTRDFRDGLRVLLKTAFAATVESILSEQGGEPEPQYLFPFLFRFLTAKIFKDRRDVRDWEKLGSPLEIFQKADKHLGSQIQDTLPPQYLHKRVLKQAWESISQSLNFQNIAVSDLAAIYESAFITERNRRELGVHSTPDGLAEYLVQCLPWDSLPSDGRRIFEPFSGHAILLATAMSRMGENLPEKWSNSRRHEYFQERLTGVEMDPFSVEVSRLLLTLSDYPNQNGWKLHNENVFMWSGWESALKNCDVLLANPPYEKFAKGDKTASNATKAEKPAELIQRIMRCPPSVLGLILPQSFLTGPAYREANKQIAQRYDDVRIVTLPKVFNYANNETMALIASGRREKGETVAVHFAEVPLGKQDAFLDDFHVSGNRTQQLLIPDKGAFSLRILPDDNVFAKLENCVPLSSVAEIHQGIHWIARTDRRNRSAPRTDVASDNPKKGFVSGCEKMNGNLSQFHIKYPRYLSLRDEHQYSRDPSYRHNWLKQKVVVNAARFGFHSPWRLAAYADSEGLAFTKEFFAIWPKEKISVLALAAVLNSPIGNAFSFLHDIERHNHVATLSAFPLPPLQHLAPGGNLDKLARDFQKLLKNSILENNALWREKLIRLDATVLDAYSLSDEVQRELLDKFIGYNRPVNFAFGNYFPECFKKPITLSDFVRITYEWDETNDRRCDLIEKKIYSPSEFTSEERAELGHLQHLAGLVPYLEMEDPYHQKHTDAFIKKLKREGKWTQ